MNTRLLKDTLGWGLFLWIIGYALGMILFTLVPPSLIGWIIMPIGTAITILVLFKQVQLPSLQTAFLIGSIWTLIAVVFDYLFLVQAFHPADGYYKPDVFLYYVLTFSLPLIVYRYKKI